MNNTEIPNSTASHRKHPHRWALRGLYLRTGIQRTAAGGLQYRRHNRVFPLQSPALTEFLGGLSSPTDMVVHDWRTEYSGALTLAVILDLGWKRMLVAVYVDAALSENDVTQIFGQARGVKLLMARNGWFANPNFAAETVTANGNYCCPETGVELRNISPSATGSHVSDSEDQRQRT